MRVALGELRNKRKEEGEIELVLPSPMSEARPVPAEGSRPRQRAQEQLPLEWRASAPLGSCSVTDSELNLKLTNATQRWKCCAFSAQH